MEFKYRAVDDRPTSTPTPAPAPAPAPAPTSMPTTTTTATSYTTPPPLSSIAYFSDRLLLGGFPSAALNPRVNTFRMPVTNANVSEALRRELEKEQIRREIERRLQLEEEVRREMAMERELGIAMQRNLVGVSQGFSFEDRVAMCFNPILSPIENIIPAPQPQLPQLMPPVGVSQGLSFEDRVAMCLNPRLSPIENTSPAPQPQLPQLMAPVEIEPSPEDTNKDKVIILVC